MQVNFMKKQELKQLIKESIKEILSEGIGIYVDGVDQNNEYLKTVGGIVHLLVTKLKYSDINTDQDYFKPIGIFWIQTRQIQNHKVRELIKQAVEFLKFHNISYTLKSEYNVNPSDGIAAVKFSITKNPNASEPLAPYMSITYTTAKVLFNDILHLPNAFKDYTLNVSIDELEKAFRISSGEVTEERYWPYITQLEKMVEYAKKHNLTRLTGA